LLPGGGCLRQVPVRRPGSSGPQTTFKELEHTNWERSAEAYAVGFGPVTVQTVGALLQSARAPAPGQRILDVACGPGFVAESIVETATERRWLGGDAVDVVAVDFARSMLEIAERRLAVTRGAQAGGASVSFVEADAESLPFDDASVDAVVCNYGVLHLSQPDTFLREAYRCLRPGGWLALSVWAPPEETEAFRLVLESVQVAGNPEVPLPEGPPFFRFGDPAEARRSLISAGFSPESVECTKVPQFWEVQDADELYQTFLNGTARSRALLEGQTPREERAVRRHMQGLLDGIMEGRPRRELSVPGVVSAGQKQKQGALL